MYYVRRFNWTMVGEIPFQPVWPFKLIFFLILEHFQDKRRIYNIGNPFFSEDIFSIRIDQNETDYCFAWDRIP